MRRSLRSRAIRRTGIGMALLLASPSVFAETVVVRVVGDNGYRVGVGHEIGLLALAPSVENLDAAQVFDGADVFEVTDPLPTTYLYVAAWSDDFSTQGLLVEAGVPGHPPVLSGQGPWQVYATGRDFDPPSGGGPSEGTIDGDLVLAYLGLGAEETSGRWVGTTPGAPGHPGVLAVGEDNGSGEGWFPAVPGIDPAARWIWFDPNPILTRDPFAGIGRVPRKEYLIFRLRLSAVPGVTQSISELLFSSTPNVTVVPEPGGGASASGFGDDFSDWLTVGVRQALSWSGRMEPTPLPDGELLLHRARGTSDGENDRTLGTLLLEGDGGHILARPDFRALLSTDVRVVILDGDRVVLDRPGLEFPPIAAPGESSPPEVLPQAGATIVTKGDPVPDVDVVLEQIPGGTAKPGGVEFSDFYQEGLGGLEGPIVPAPAFDLLLGARADLGLDGETYRGDRIRFLMEPMAGSLSVETLETVEIRTTLPSLAWTSHSADRGVVFSGLPLAPLGDGEIAAGVIEGLSPVAFLSGLGPSGKDGALFDLGEAGSFSLDWEPEDLAIAQEGAHAEVLAVVESGPGIAVAGGLRVTNASAVFGQELSLRTPPGATRARVFVDGQEVGQVVLPEPDAYLPVAAAEGPPGSLGITVDAPEMKVARSGGAEPWAASPRGAQAGGLSFRATWKEPVSMVVEGGSSLMGREVVLVTDAEVPSLVGAGVRGKDLPGLHLGEVAAGAPEDTSPEPPAGPWLETPALPGFRFKVRVTGPGGAIETRQEADCIPETLCISGAVPGRSELFLRIVGPKPNGFLWPNIVKFSTSRIEVWIERTSTGATNYYLLDAASPGSSDLSGLFDRLGFPATAVAGGVAWGGAPGRRARLAPTGSEPDPPAGPWLQTGAIPGFRFKVRVTGPGGAIETRQEADCIPETLCISGAIPGRSELFLRIVGPKPNGFLWPNIVKFSTSQIEVWAEQPSSGQQNYYLLQAASPGSSELTGFFDRNGFLP